MTSNISVLKNKEYTGHKGPIYSLAPSYRPGHFLSCASEGIVAEWSLNGDNAEAVAQTPGPIFSMRLVPERNLLLLGLQSGDLVFADLKVKTTLRRVQLHKKAIFDFALHPDGKHFFASSEDGAISVWDLDKMEHEHYQVYSPKSIRSLALNPNEALYAGSSDGKIRVFDLGLKLQRSWDAHSNSVFRVAVSTDAPTLFSTGRDAHLKSWDLSQSAPPAVDVAAHNFAVNDIVLHPSGQFLFTGSMDKTIKVWNPGNLELLKVINFEKNQCHFNGINRLLWLEDRLLSCSDDRKIMEWKLTF